ncbi:hypothetical protein OESDEN_17020 [Oesophagostomum dentatum]|uniref:Uncharacterized protein n=1 Tax=Oesophagostomum dentatum TaxID=61180 RepID=A0A0B1SDA2_OESDE|nr:hypothetical protein OESDEN_17020 [Oesophagostomum dentatum]
MENSHRLSTHGDAVKDVAFRVDDIDAVAERLLRNNVDVLVPKTTLQDEDGFVTMLKLQAKRLLRNNVDVLVPKTKLQDEDGFVTMLKLQSKGSDITHTLIDDKNYHGIFLPGFQPIDNYSLCKTL